MYVKASIAVLAQAFPGESAWKLRITYSNKGSESHISTGKRASLDPNNANRGLMKRGTTTATKDTVRSTHGSADRPGEIQQ
jgi:hypothetical protein